jgi:hypothetical protein
LKFQPESEAKIMTKIKAVFRCATIGLVALALLTGATAYVTGNVGNSNPKLVADGPWPEPEDGPIG